MTIGAPPRIPGFTDAISPSSINAIVGGLVGVVGNVRNWQDGNIVQINEAANTPGMNVEFLCENVQRIQRVAFAGFYSGSDTHYVNIQLHDYIDSGWKTLITFPNALGHNLRYVHIPLKGHRFFDANGNAKIRVFHPVGGNAAHRAYIDFIGLLP